MVTVTPKFKRLLENQSILYTFIILLHKIHTLMLTKLKRIEILVDWSYEVMLHLILCNMKIHIQSLSSDYKSLNLIF